MTYRPLSDPNEIRDIEVETPEMVENDRLVECGERQLRMLRRMGDIGIALVERLEDIAISRAEAASREGAAPATIDDIAGAYGKLTQSLRRTLAMEARLAEQLKAHRLGAVATRIADHEDTIKVVHKLVDDNIEHALTKAIRRERPDAGRETNERLLMDMFERLNDSDDFDDYRERPPGETIAKLCAVFGLDPEFCIQADDETWMVRHGNPPPSHLWGATDAERVRVGQVTESGAGVLPDEPHPDGFAICPSP